MKQMFKVDIDPAGRYHPDILRPTTETEMEQLTQAAAKLLVAISVAAARNQELVCHHGCVFAAMIDMAHKYFHEEDADEYRRVVESGQLTKSIVVGVGH